MPADISSPKRGQRPGAIGRESTGRVTPCQQLNTGRQREAGGWTLDAGRWKANLEASFGGSSWPRGLSSSVQRPTSDVQRPNAKRPVLRRLFQQLLYRAIALIHGLIGV